MNQPPAFQFYPDDFIGGTVHMTAEDCGAYIRLLCYQWGHGKAPVSKAEIDRVAGCVVSDTVLDKFRRGKNARLESERTKQIEYRKKQAENGAKGGRPSKRVGLGLGSNRETQTKAKKSSPSPSPSPSTEVPPVPPERELALPPSPPKSNHQAFIQGWSDNFKALFGSDYRYDGRDSKAVQSLLRMNILVIDLLEIAKAAWKRGIEDKYSTSCKRASTIFDFNNQFNQIQVELKRKYENNGPAGSKSFDRNKGTLNEGRAERYDLTKIQAARALRDAGKPESGANA